MPTAEVQTQTLLHSQPPTLVERVSRHADDERDADVANRQRTGNDRDEALTLVLADVARAKRQLRARHEQDHAENAGWKEPLPAKALRTRTPCCRN